MHVVANTSLMIKRRMDLEDTGMRVQLNIACRDSSRLDVGSPPTQPPATTSNQGSAPPDSSQLDAGLILRYWNAVSRSCLTALSRWKVYLLPVTSQFIMKWPSSNFGRISSARLRSRSLFAARMGHF
ncbi:hypothetical protein NQZ68_029520 [Dissostichus eleginoides]|nr:hypothetical protein NQZ68_029520 [Dissostichus eleginoides]